MPAPVQSGSTANHREYPCAVFVGPTLVFATDGAGLLYVFSIKDTGLSEAIGIYHLPRENDYRPFKLHYCHRSSPTTAIAVISSKVPNRNGNSDSGSKRQNQTVFDIWAVQVNLLSLRPDGFPTPFDVLWHHCGEDVPTYGSFQPQFNSHILIGGTVYADPSIPTPAPYEPSPSEIAPIPRANENLDESGGCPSEPQKPPPYSWSQTPDSVIVAIPLPSATSKNNIRVAFSVKAITVHVDYQASTSIPIPRYSAKELWDTISPSSSLWTWDKSAEHSYGLLTLHLEKQHEGTRWMHVFAAAGTQSNDPQDVEVPETLDPSELWQIRETLEKYTASLRDGSDASGLGLGSGVPSLASGEIDEEVDMSVGRKVYLTWVAADGAKPAWFNTTEQIPFQLLATLLPGVHATELPLVIKHNLDGLVFNLKASTTEEPLWIHDSTFSALAFVLASKRDTRFTYIVPGKAVLSFEGGGRNRGGNVYIYRPAAKKDNWAKQSILRVDGGEGEALLGVGGLTNGAGEFIIVCLLEGTLVVMKKI
ncbi:hypothetical protein CC1G_12325 [Coprinopsis cinerea okayama7|uniref:NudC domain-containing protein 1 n=1 Tax=Coprinopsis cinerea (strain Okayama-7 / 130 / ATCC MYA-4618 / FGSC 9003) TaxID=240176 RepID=A8NS77_COPC7|nr:hypothetical protein CC1G_12325 [Coprinopsis cinerea okayama7\|eukprot:XP_001835955.2 hypothetical protein CC1G_12325 [Coprinopsis cinerea okayama7\